MSIFNKEYQELSVLEQLKRDYNQGIMSAFIGSGFSLNVSEQHYLTWYGLLYDMVYSKYEKEIEREYIQYKKNNRKNKKCKNKKDFIWEYISSKIKEKGALSIASQYVCEHDNMHESIDSYIEDHIPYAKMYTDGIHLFKRGEEIYKCDKRCLSLHKLLLQCVNFRNFFTTNYDNLLELAIETKGEQIKIIRHGHELSNTSAYKKIIKIHGSITDTEDCNNSFDGCNGQKYIITKEDYDSYAEKHSAFKNVINTEMLQGVFCLIGFSGTDPNFRECIKWLLDILKPKKESQVKFYLIDLSEDPPLDYFKLFCENNYIKIVRLRDREMMNQIGVGLSTISDNQEYMSTCKHEISHHDLLGAFFSYLQTTSLNFNDTIKISTYDKSFFDTKCSVYDYRKLWEECLRLLRNNVDLLPLISDIQKQRKTIRFCRIIFPQEHVVDYMMSKKPLTEEKAYLFALAVKDIGQIPSYYVNYHKDDENLNKQSLWKRLLEREKTLKGSIDILSETDDDWAIYEQIQRYLFNLDFAKSKELVEQWKAKGYWMQNKIMRMAVYDEELEEIQKQLDDVINKEQNPSEKLYEIILANYISRSWTPPYSTDDFWKHGLFGQTEMLNFMMSEFGKKKEKPKRRGWIGTVWNIGNNDGDYVRSLRILQYIIDSGIYVSITGTYIFDVANWYIVFSNLYEYFPYPCFFYSIQYNDKDVQRRIGEDYAYNDKLQYFNKDILLKALDAIENDKTPTQFKNGILNVISAIYVAVDENIWFKRFKEVVFKSFIQNLNTIKESSEVVYNVKFALGSLKNPANINWVFQQLLFRYSINESIISDIIVNCLAIDLIQKKKNIDDIFSFINELNRETLDLLNTLNNEGFLSKASIESICENILNVDVENIPHDRVVLFHIFNLVKENKQAIDKVKQCFLSMNIWHCGVLDNEEFGWTEPMYIRLNLLNDKITWTDEEFEVIKDNLVKNVSIYSNASKHFHDDAFTKNIQTRYLSDMLKFIDGLNEERKRVLCDVRNDIERLFNVRIQYNDNIDLMMSDQPADVDYALRNIYEGISNNGIELHMDDLDFLIGRAIMKMQIALTRNLKYIKFIVLDNYEKMISLGYTKKLNKLLSVYKDSDSWYLLDLRFAFNYLYCIAQIMKQNGESNEVIDFWLEDAFVNRFVIKK